MTELSSMINVFVTAHCWMEISNIPDSCGTVISLNFSYFLPLITGAFKKKSDSRSLDLLSAWLTGFHGYMLLTILPSWETNRSLVSKKYVCKYEDSVQFVGISHSPPAFACYSVVRIYLQYCIIFIFMSVFMFFSPQHV